MWAYSIIVQLCFVFMLYVGLLIVRLCFMSELYSIDWLIH